MELLLSLAGVESAEAGLVRKRREEFMVCADHFVNDPEFICCQFIRWSVAQLIKKK